jgi:hypothetical protein
MGYFAQQTGRRANKKTQTSGDAYPAQDKTRLGEVHVP